MVGTGVGLRGAGWSHRDAGEFFAAVPEAKVVDALPDGVSVTFDLRGDGGGTWTVSRHGGRTAVSRHEAAAPDCRLACTVADFRALVNGELDPRAGFLEGRLAVEGDVGLVLKLQRTMGR